LLENGFSTFLTKKVPEKNVEKSIQGTQKPRTFIGNRQIKLRN